SNANKWQKRNVCSQNRQASIDLEVSGTSGGCGHETDAVGQISAEYGKDSSNETADERAQAFCAER
ncbi:MAG: hypothetical protein AAFX40_19100, partial [Cyanobacteria bacterium J06639_1]